MLDNGVRMNKVKQRIAQFGKLGYVARDAREGRVRNRALVEDLQV